MSEPTFNPERFDVPSFDEIQTDDDLKQHAKAYTAVVAAHYDADVDVSHISFSVSHRAKRRAAAMKSVNLGKLAFTDTLMTEMTDEKWTELQNEHGHKLRGSDRFDHVKDVEMCLTWDAFEAFDRDEWLNTIRHEIAHIEQFHETGDADHGIDFHIRADKFDTDNECPQFTDYDYPFFCRECGDQCGGRYRRSKAVKFAEKSLEEQEKHKENGGKYWYSNCCEAFLTT